MAWFTYRFWASDDGQSYRDVTDIAPHPSWPIAQAVRWAHDEVKHGGLTRYRFLELQRRQGSYRPRGTWKTLAWWRFGEPFTVAGDACRGESTRLPSAPTQGGSVVSEVLSDINTKSPHAGAGDGQ